ncbi:tape measure protein [Methylobacterium sp. Leaf118]|uniref:tape measure protein n=1 Tax=Methylobacterium sp. Leaf118 TaxID=2876562 RepID=UPI001E295B62|nr:tape measure protein [Methylobacterium sp. Leaf118]
MPQVVTELVIDARSAKAGASDYEKAMNKAAAAADRAANAEDRLQGKIDGSGDAHSKATRLLAERSSAFDRLRAKVDSQFALEQRMARAQSDADRAVRRGQVSQAQAAATLDAYRAKQERVLGITPRLSAANDNAAGSFATMAGAASRLGPVLAMVGSALALIGGGAALAGIAKAGLQMESLERGFAAAAGSAEQGAREFAFIKDTSERLGLALGETSTQYLSFLAASRGTALQGQATREVFVAVSSAMGALGKDSETTGRALIAVQQMMSKGKVSAEEMTGQLGEALPGALSLSAKAMGMTQTALLKLMGDGKLFAADLLPKLAKELQATYGDAAAKAANGLQANLNRMSTAWLELRDTIARNGFNDALSRAAGDVAGFLRAGQDGAAEWGRSLASVVDTLRSVGAAAVEAYDSAKIVLQMVGEFDQVLSGKTIDYGSLVPQGASRISDFLATALEADKAYINGVIGVFTAGYQMAVAAWEGLPSAFGGYGAAAANALISAVEGAVNFVVRGFNKVVEAVNAIGENVPGFSRLATAAEVSLGRVEAASGKTASQLASDLAGIGKAAMSRDYLGEAGTAIANRFNELKEASKAAREERKRLADQASSDKLADALRNTGDGAKQAAADIDKAGKAAKAAAQEFERFKSQAEEAFKKLFPEDALRKQGQELQGLLDKYRDHLAKIDPRYVTAIETKIKLNLDGKELEGVKAKTDDLAKEMSHAFSGVFDEMFSAGNKGLDGLVSNLTKSLAKIGTRQIEQNILAPLFSGKDSPALKLFDFDKMEKAVSSGASTGIFDSMSEWLKPQKEGGGFMSSKLGGGLVAAGAGAAIGYQSQNPIVGCVGGALTGFTIANDDEPQEQAA